VPGAPPSAPMGRAGRARTSQASHASHASALAADLQAALAEAGASSLGASSLSASAAPSAAPSAASTYTASTSTVGDEPWDGATSAAFGADGAVDAPPPLLCSAADDDDAVLPELSASVAARISRADAKLPPSMLPEGFGAEGGGGAPPPSATRKRPRCKACNLRLPLTATCASACQCGDIFCARHLHAHDCSFDYHSREQHKLAEDNPKMAPSKLERLG